MATGSQQGKGDQGKASWIHIWREIKDGRTRLYLQSPMRIQTQAAADKDRKVAAVLSKLSLFFYDAIQIDKFDSISINDVMHCVPGSFKEKGIAFSNLALFLAPGATLFAHVIRLSRQFISIGRH